MPQPDIRSLWRSAQAVCFDVDSTVSPDEGIDVLAAHAGVGEQVAALTRSAMGGSVLFQDALRARLELIRPSRQLVAACLAAHPPRLTPGIQRLVRLLTGMGKDVYLVSGGFRLMIEPLAAMLELPDGRVFANTLLFHEDGTYAGFDENEPTSRSGGKGVVIARLKKTHGYHPLIMIGDGATDLEARPPADGFICYGGVVSRKNVSDKADWSVLGFDDLIAELTTHEARQ